MARASGQRASRRCGCYLHKGLKNTGAHVAFRAPNHAAIQKFHAEGLKAGGRDNGAAGHRARLQPDLLRRVPARPRRQQCRGGVYVVKPSPPSLRGAPSDEAIHA